MFGVLLSNSWDILTRREDYGSPVPVRTGPLCALGAMAAWGFAQWATLNTEYAYATRVRSVELTAFAAVAFGFAWSTRDPRTQKKIQEWLAAFGFLLSVVSVLAYFTAQGKIFWVFASPYPDIWGPFLSRNDFAMFLEITFPAAFALGVERGARWPPLRNPHLWIAAWMYAAGLASASRAGAALLTAEAFLLLWTAPRRWRFYFGAAALASIAVAGAGTLLGRLQLADPFAVRREIAASTIEVISERPIRGFGLGTFPQIYPSHARLDAGALVQHAHNDWLEWCAEGGIPFALVWLTLAISTVPGAFRSKWGLGVGAVFVHALVDYPFAKPGLAAWVFALIGTLEAGRNEKSTRPRPLTMQVEGEHS
ncbi:MAG: O-antigen ligase family protein [Bryobacteraceae bacterium]